MHGRIPELFSSLMTPYLSNLDEVVLPGLISVTWIALNIHTFVESIHKAVGEVDLLIDRVTGVQQNRVDLALQEILEVELCALPPSDEVMSIEEFMQGSKVHCDVGVQYRMYIACGALNTVFAYIRLALAGSVLHVQTCYRSLHYHSQNTYVRN